MAAEVHRYKVGDIEVTVLSTAFAWCRWTATT